MGVIRPDSEDYKALTRAEYLLEHVGFTQRIVDLLGRPVDYLFDLLPKPVHRGVERVSMGAMRLAASLACGSLGRSGWRWNNLHRLAVVGAGASGGFFGLPGLALELPVSTTLIIRSVGQIARSQGENPADYQTRLACLEVFALGGGGKTLDKASRYLNTRVALSQNIRATSLWLASDAARRKAPPVLIRLTQSIASRFSIVVEEKVLAGAIPLIGAAGGAAVNGVFISLFQDKALGHFIYRRLERTYGRDEVREAYEGIRRERLA